MDSVIQYKQLEHTLSFRDSTSSAPPRNIQSGQKKLFTAELQFLMRVFLSFADSDSQASAMKRTKVLYIGAAQGHHLYKLAEMFPLVTFVLYDMREFAEELKTLPNVELHQQRFTDELIPLYKAWARENILLFISDIRGEVTALRKNASTDAEAEHFIKITEGKINMDMRQQENWVLQLSDPNNPKNSPLASLLKFRPMHHFEQKPYLPSHDFTYLKGEVLLQAYAPLESSECRLLVWGKDRCEMRVYNSRLHDAKMCFFNHKIRPLDCSAFDEKSYLFTMHQYEQLREVLRHNKRSRM